MQRNRIVLLLIALGLLALLIGPTTTVQPAQAQGTNLLLNPSFEGNFVGYVPNPAHALYGYQVADCTPGWGTADDAICNTAQLPANWWPWWISQTEEDPDWKNRMPEYKPAEAPFLNHVRSGDRALQYFTFHGTHTAGALQIVPVPANAQLRFSVWGHAWSNAGDEPYSGYPTTVNMRVGIDPLGGSNPYAPSIVWSGYANVYDNYALFSVEAQAQGELVSVWTFSAPAEARKHNDVYWDDATLEVIGEGAPVAPPPGGGGSGGSSNTAPPVAPPSAPTPTPNADGVILVTVQAGDSLWAIAARAGLTLDEILELNNLSSSDFVNPGDQLIIGYGEPGGAEEETAETESTEETAEEATPEATATPAATPTPAAVAEVPDAPSGASICLNAFDDVNRNGIFDAGEAVKEAVAFTVASGGRVVSNYVTTGDEAEPFCIEGLAAGDYDITRSSKDSEVLTTPGNWAVSLADGTVKRLEFGSYVDTSAATTDDDSDALAAAGNNLTGAAELAEQSDSESDGGNGLMLALIVVAVAVVLLLAVVAIILTARRAAAN